MGSYVAVSDLDAVKAKVEDMKTDIIALLQQNDLDIDDDAIVLVRSATSQVVAGTNYRVTLAIGQYESVIVGYFVPLPSDDSKQTPTNLHLISFQLRESVGSYTEMSDLATVKTTISGMESDIRKLLSTEGLFVEDDDEIDVVSAESQVVAGTNYYVTIDVGSLLEDVVIAYFVNLPVNDETQTPSNLRLIDLGTTITLVDTTSESESDSGESSETLQDQQSDEKNMTVTVQWIIIASLLAFVALIVCIAMSLCLRKNNKTQQGNELYASLNSNIDETL